jgi:hypothetical protein
MPAVIDHATFMLCPMRRPGCWAPSRRPNEVSALHVGDGNSPGRATSRAGRRPATRGRRWCLPVTAHVRASPEPTPANCGRYAPARAPRVPVVRAPGRRAAGALADDGGEVGAERRGEALADRPGSVPREAEGAGGPPAMCRRRPWREAAPEQLELRQRRHRRRRRSPRRRTPGAASRPRPRSRRRARRQCSPTRRISRSLGSSRAPPTSAASAAEASRAFHLKSDPARA